MSVKHELARIGNKRKLILSLDKEGTTRNVTLLRLILSSMQILSICKGPLTSNHKRVD